MESNAKEPGFGDPADLRRAVEAVRWFHRIGLPGGIVTPGVDDTPAKLARLDLPADLTGTSVLDVGAWDGFFSFEAERRGASRVLATDSFVWSGRTWGSKAGFDLARAALGSRVEERLIAPGDLSADAVGRFDLVLFLGVLYHLEDPMGVLRRVRDVTAKRLVLETEVDLLWHRRPAAAFYPSTELMGDPTNWWGPNPAAVEGMLRAVGFRDVRLVGVSPGLPHRLAKAAWFRAIGRRPFRESAQRARAVFHAFA
ncbi:MAG: tRNA 5-methoxyuridine(34)/uridine 5-oxyacetic acid(34) synthase CmoB [Planctomycetes bacterium]|nr:tRNA 5-methoxyuridine(34)/uridine 5-oxyacetic acid(34) synthase CmoB [Planctomycetota bacterium]MCK6530321.1 tRNA 5-methoxyuridine(34)/uridine 5-oxyacetic acid(34) synthase CmoB [Myxococcota bacterium]